MSLTVASRRSVAARCSEAACWEGRRRRSGTAPLGSAGAGQSRQVTAAAATAAVALPWHGPAAGCARSAQGRAAGWPDLEAAGLQVCILRPLVAHVRQLLPVVGRARSAGRVLEHLRQPAKPAVLSELPVSEQGGQACGRGAAPPWAGASSMEAAAWRARSPGRPPPPQPRALRLRAAERRALHRRLTGCRLTLSRNSIRPWSGCCLLAGQARVQAGAQADERRLVASACTAACARRRLACQPLPACLPRAGSAAHERRCPRAARRPTHVCPRATR